MDRRIVFLLVFTITLSSTLVVAFVSFWVGQSWLRTALFSLATMWVVGIISQVLFLNLYQSIVKPIEEERLEEVKKVRQQELNLQDVEEIGQAAQLLQEASRQEKENQQKEKPQIGV